MVLILPSPSYCHSHVLETQPVVLAWVGDGSYEETESTPGHWLPLSGSYAVAVLLHLILICFSIWDNTWYPYDWSYRPLLSMSIWGRREGKGLQVLPGLGGEVGFFPSKEEKKTKTLFLSWEVLLLFRFCALEEVSLREKTSASGSFIFFYIKNLESSTHFKLSTWELCHPQMCGQGFVLVWFLTKHQLPPLPGQLCLVLSSKCFLELWTASSGKFLGFPEWQKSWKICFLPLKINL